MGWAQAAVGGSDVARAHKHKALKTIATLPYGGALRPVGEQVTGAHGHICLVQVCACGATRSVNVNAPFTEEGDWRVYVSEPIF